MAGDVTGGRGDNVTVDAEAEEDASFHVPARWLLGLAVVVLVALIVLPGRTGTPVTSTTLAFPDLEPLDERWRPVEMPGRGNLRDVARLLDGGYLAVGDGGQAWRYDGAEAWEWVPTGVDPSGSLPAVAAHAGGAVMVGRESPDGSSERATIVRSDDGRSWTTVSLEDSGEVASGLDGVVVDGNQLLSWGWSGSPRYLVPEAEALVLHSPDGATWNRITTFDDRSARLFAVRNVAGIWYAGGTAAGRPALWESDTLREWTPVETRSLPFGWAIVDVAAGEDDSLRAMLANLSEGRAREWSRGEEGWLPLDERPGRWILPVEGDGDLGVGEGSLWVRSEESEEWEALDLAGEVTSAIGDVAVGASREFQPKAWVRDSAGEQRLEVPVGGTGSWETVRELGSEHAVSWSVAGGWVLGGSAEEWLFLTGDGQHRFAPPWGDRYMDAVAVAGEWVVLPTMHWTDNGVEWEQRAVPWPDMEAAPTVVAVAESNGRVWALGQDHMGEWAVATSGDQGRSWSSVGDAAPNRPIWSVAGADGGFVATAGGPGGTREVVVSDDGRTWETYAPGGLLTGVHPPTALTPDGSLALFDTGEEIRPPRADVTALARTAEGSVILVAGGRMWRQGEPAWEEIPLDPPHGMGAGMGIRPVPLDDRLLAVGRDRQQRLLYEWRP